MNFNQERIELVDALRKKDSENEWLEFKANYISNQVIGEYISALSNGAAICGVPNAYLIYGIDDNSHEVIGTTFNYRKTKQGNEDLENWLSRLLEPKIGFTIYEIDYSAGKKVVMFEIPAAYNQPTAFSGKEYVRIGSCCKPLNKHPSVEKKLWSMLNGVSYEQATSVNQNLHFKNLSIIANSKDIDFSEEKFATLRLLDSNGRFNNLALLISDENPHMVKFAFYKNDALEFVVKKEFTGSWISILDQVLEYVQIYNDVSAKVEGGNATRTEIQSYPDPSLREIIVNAFAHLDLAFPSDIKIEVFPDRIEIASPGGLYMTTMDEVLSGRQSFRNPNLVFVLNKFKYIENYATGLRKTLKAYEGYAQKPNYEPTENFFVVSLPNVNYVDAVNESVDLVNDTVNRQNESVNGADDHVNLVYDHENDHEKLQPKKQREGLKGILLDLIKENPQIKRTEIEAITGVSSSTIGRKLAELKSGGIIQRVGSDKKGEWVIIKKD